MRFHGSQVTEEKPFVEEGESKEDDKITQVFVELSPGEDTQDSQVRDSDTDTDKDTDTVTDISRN